MNPKLFREICLQNGRGVLQQIAEPEVALGFVWLELHLGHTLQLAGRLVDDLPIPAGPFQGASYLEWLSLDYAEQCRGVKQLQHIALRVYLSACPLYGQDFLRETLGRLGHSAMTEKEGRKLLSIARAMGEDTVGATICRTLSASADAAGQRATAVYWLLQAGETALADALAEKMLRELSEASLSPKPKEPSAAEVEEEEARDQERRDDRAAGRGVDRRLASQGHGARWRVDAAGARVPLRRVGAAEPGGCAAAAEGRGGCDDGRRRAPPGAAGAGTPSPLIRSLLWWLLSVDCVEDRWSKAWRLPWRSSCGSSSAARGSCSSGTGHQSMQRRRIDSRRALWAGRCCWTRRWRWRRSAAPHSIATRPSRSWGALTL